MNIQLGQYAGFCFGVDRAVVWWRKPQRLGGHGGDPGAHHSPTIMWWTGSNAWGWRWQTAGGVRPGVRWCSVPTACRQVEDPGWIASQVDATCPFVKRFTAWFRRQRRRDGPP